MHVHTCNSHLGQQIGRRIAVLDTKPVGTGAGAGAEAGAGAGTVVGAGSVSDERSDYAGSSVEKQAPAG